MFENVYGQFPVLAPNSIDREGCVLKNIYERVRFRYVAVPVVGKTDRFKIPYSLSKLRGVNFPRMEGGKGIYESNSYVVLEVDDIMLSLLDLARAHGSLDRCDDFLNVLILNQDDPYFEFFPDIQYRVTSALERQ